MKGALFNPDPISRLLKKYHMIFLMVFLVVHFLIKDHIWLSSLIFYTMPLPVLIGISGACIYINKRCRKVAVVAGIIMLFLLFYWIRTSYKFPGETYTQRNSIRVLFWNIAAPKNHPNPELIRHIKQMSPDIAGIVESGRPSEDIVKMYESALPNYAVSRLRGGMLVFTKGRIHKIRNTKLRHRSRYNLIEIELNQRSYHVLLVDISKNPWFSRKERLDALFTVAKQNERTIIMGDFNTPYNSVHFQDYKKHYYHAFHLAGTGFAETWPYGIPLLEIDHIWSSQDLKPVRMKKEYDWLSDHAQLVVDFEV